MRPTSVTLFGLSLKGAASWPACTGAVRASRIWCSITSSSGPGRGSAALLKELMRRSVQFAQERATSRELETADVKAALDELLFSGGRLNAAPL